LEQTAKKNAGPKTKTEITAEKEMRDSRQTDP
jgi:hypothetical protein